MAYRCNQEFDFEICCTWASTSSYLGNKPRNFLYFPNKETTTSLISILSKPDLVLFSFSFSFVQLQLQIHLEWNLVKSLLGWALRDFYLISIW